MTRNETCSSRGYRSLVLSQFLGALNDNIFKLLVSLLVVNQLVEGEGDMWTLVLINICFVSPFLIFSTIAGCCADRFSKAIVLRVAKVIEVVVLVLGGVFLASQNVTALLVVLFLLGMQATLFSPSKYGSLPELVQPELLSKANGYLEMWTFIAIIVGTAFGGVLMGLSESPMVPGYTIVAIALLGLLVSFGIPKTEVADATSPFEWNPLAVVPVVRKIRENRDLFLTLLAIGYFWAVGALLQLNLLLYAKQLSHLGDLGTSLLLMGLGVGIGVGSLLAGVVSEGKVELGLVPLGAIGMGVASLLLTFITSIPLLTFAFLLLLGVSSGFFVVPLNSFFQQQSPAAVRGSYLAASNFIAYSGIMISSFVLLFAIDVLRLSPAQVCGLVSLSAFAVAFVVCRMMPLMMVRCINWLIAHTLYRLRVEGKLNVPKTGGALIVCNHVAYVDPPLLLATVDRPIRFLMYRPIYESPLIRPLAKLMRAIPIAPEDNRRDLVTALNEAKDALRNGEIVCIFAEGALTRLGHLLKFERGFEVIMKGVDVPIVPAFIDQVWGSIFSYKNGKFFWKVPREIPYPITLAFGAPLPATAKAHEVRAATQQMAAELAIARKERYPQLHSSFIHQAKCRPWRTAIVDSDGRRLRYLSLLAVVLAAAKRIRTVVGEQKMVGLLLPPSSGGAIANLGVMCAGRVPVNLNYTAAQESVDSAIAQCEIRTVLTSRRFIDKIGSDKLPQGANVKTVYLEDLLGGISKLELIARHLQGLLLPHALLRHSARTHEGGKDALATVIFSSGSTGEPKGVMLSHANIQSNIESLYETFQLTGKDGVLGILPFFHSFGFTGTLWLPLLSGIKAVYHPNPMDSGTVGDLVQRERATILMSTPTFLLGYIRKCEREQFASLRYVVVGAEKLKERIASAFQEKFGIVPLEGYGCTELSPVAVLNVPDVEDGKVKQVGQKLGTVGHPLPGVAVRVVDPESYETLPPDTEGLFLVRGPNVMLGYLGNRQKTAEVIRDGWYVTGDIAKIDEDGFVTITDRLSRFSKIGGEMVPHIKIEEAIHKVLGSVETVCVVTAVPDEKRGEKLVVLHKEAIDVVEVVKKLSEEGLPNLWIPKKESFFSVELLPMLGSGKLDLKAVKALAAELASQNESA